MTEEILRDLRQAAREAEVLGGVIADARSRMPQRAEGTDHTGAVRTVLGPDGLPISIEVAADWRDLLVADAFGAAVLDAFSNATRARTAAWSKALEDPRRTSTFDQHRRDPGHERPNAVPDSAWADRPMVVVRLRRAVRPRPMAAIVEEVLRAADDLANLAQHAQPAPTGTGSDASGELVLTLSEAGVVSCSAPAHWLSYQSGDALTSALAEALASARGDLATAVDARRPDDRSGRLLDELFATFADSGRLGQS